MKDKIEFKSDFGVDVDPSELEKPVFNLLGLATAAIAIFGWRILLAIVNWLMGFFMKEPGQDQGAGWAGFGYAVLLLFGLSIVWVILGVVGIIFAKFSIDRYERWKWLAMLQIVIYSICLLLIAAFWISLFLIH